MFAEEYQALTAGANASTVAGADAAPSGGPALGVVLVLFLLVAVGLTVAVRKRRCCCCRRGGQRARLMDKPPALQRTNTSEIEAAIAAAQELEGSPMKKQHALNDPEWAET